MKTLLLVLLALPVIAAANPPTKKSVPGAAPPAKTVPVAPPITNAPTAIGTGGNATGGSALATGGNATGGTGFGTGGSASAMTGPVTAGNQLQIDMKGSAYAPDVISYPTAHCRIAIGGSGGNAVVSLGFSGSVLDENCELIELSKHATLTLGQKDVGTQIMCLSPKVRQVYDAMGIKCLVALPVAAEEPTKP